MSLSSLVRIAVTFVLSFALAKGVSFLAALAIPRLVDTATYGVIELAMTVGILASSLLNLGIPAASTRLYLTDKVQNAPVLLAGSVLWISAIGLVASFALARLGFDDAAICCAAILGLYGLQFSASVYTRMRGYIHLSGWFDNIAILLVCGLLAVLINRQTPKPADMVIALSLISALIAAAAIIVLARARVQRLMPLLRRSLSLGFGMMLFSVSTLLVFGTMRIAIDRALSLPDVAAYSLCARATLVLVFLGQVLATGFFKQLYEMESAEVSRIFTGWVLVLSGSAVVLALLAHFFTPLLVIGTDIPAGKVGSIFPSVTVQTSLWILNSNLELYILRELLSRQAALAFVLTVAAGLVVGLILHVTGMLDLVTIINLYSIGMVVVLLLQMRLLAQRGIGFRRSYVALPLIAAPWLVALLP